ncbi:Hint domain-containing protein [Alloyangia pacifica]|uniref:Hint domain-containing protein n=1 Tax=Alloyangia pacifica TaxID=311180 RepID=UPI001CD19C4D|nr:Hint domain-containing protein [Alloyangia pacifica]MCA0996709.1 Hint domain-containing protein [Alloyangia pacifica]
MASSDITVTPYDGALLTTQLLASQQTIVLGDFGSETSGTLIDDDGLLGSTDDGTALFNGDPVTYIGSGTATPGVDVGGVTVPLGTSVDVVAFEAAGQIYFHYPAGGPNLLSAVAVVVDIDTSPYQVFTPLCFAQGTHILTSFGDRRIETLRRGDMAKDIDGKLHEIKWIGRLDLRIPNRPAYRKWRPVRVAAHAFGRNHPYRDTWLSQQHRVLVKSALNELYFGDNSCLAPVVRLADGDRISIDTSVETITYYHVLCERHAVLRANGMAAESLHPGQVAREGAGRAAFGEFDLAEMKDKGDGPPAAPVLRGFEARLMASQGIR